jgi:hypothetical protein
MNNNHWKSYNNIFRKSTAKNIIYILNQFKTLHFDALNVISESIIQLI